MNKISKWKLGLIIAVFVFSVLYLLPTIPGIYGRLYGYFDIWMQGKIPPPDIQTERNSNYIRFVIPDDLPKGISSQDASKSIKDLVRRRLINLGIDEVLELESTQEVTSEKQLTGFSFEDVIITNLYIDFLQPRSKAELEDIKQKLSSIVSRSPALPTGKKQGSIKLVISKNDIPDGKTQQEGVKEIREKVTEILEDMEIKPGDNFRFDSNAGSEIYVKFTPPKSAQEIKKLINKMSLYGNIPLALRPIFPDNPLKQGLDLKGGLHIVLELDVKKAMDIYLSDQAQEAILSTLKREKIFCRSIEKTLEQTDDYTFIVRPYTIGGVSVSQSQAISEMRNKLIEAGFDSSEINDTSTTDNPQLTVKTTEKQYIGDLVDELLGGDNPLIVTITIPTRFQDADRTDYLENAEKTLRDMELFDPPKLLRSEGNTAIYSVQLSENSAQKLAEDNLDTVMETLENRINKFGVAESTIRRISGRPRILIEVPEEQNPARTLAAIKSPGILEFKLVLKNPLTGSLWYGTPGTPEPAPDELPQGAEVRYHVDGGWYVVGSEAFMHGTDLKGNSATVARGQLGTPEVLMYMTSEGQDKFSDFTGKNVGEHTAIMLDDVIQSVPRITEKISSRSARITGQFTTEEADYLARILKAGAFPAPMRSAEERIVGPTLGEEAIERGKLAFIIGISLVIVFMIIYYKLSGIIAILALLFNFVIILGILAGFGATLTLPGMAGLILTVGMSVDANVLILERIRDELRSGKTVLSSISSGYQKAFWTILDANMTTLLTAIVLYEFGTGPIKGFAVTLAVGIIASMFTALVFTREVYSWIYNRRGTIKLSI
ncbi:protein translocase subunit SecD [Candidatus Poribacteria bacterium]|nr:protein translocase subunit SecD [Candidatus Poribacteria bacterium]